MTASDTGPEIPADCRALTRSLRLMPDKAKLAGAFEADCCAAADLIEAQAAIMADQAARIASLEAERARTVEAERVIGKLMSLIINVEWWVSNGCSETAREAIKAAREDGWSKMGWRPYLEAKRRALSPLGPSDGANR